MIGQPDYDSPALLLPTPLSQIVSCPTRLSSIAISREQRNIASKDVPLSPAFSSLSSTFLGPTRSGGCCPPWGRGRTTSWLSSLKTFAVLSNQLGPSWSTTAGHFEPQKSFSFYAWSNPIKNPQSFSIFTEWRYLVSPGKQPLCVLRTIFHVDTPGSHSNVKQILSDKFPFCVNKVSAILTTQDHSWLTNRGRSQRWPIGDWLLKGNNNQVSAVI